MFSRFDTISTDMEFHKKNRGPYVCFKPVGAFTAGLIVQLKGVLTDELKDSTNDFALDMRKVVKIDVTGLRFISNFIRVLAASNRKLVLFGPNLDVLKNINETEGIDCKVYHSLEEFERGFHEMSAEAHDYYLELADGEGEFRNLELECPLCHCDNVKAFIIDESEFGLEWVPDSITPKWSLFEDSANEIDWDLYQVAVCPECYFASTRLDWFQMNIKEGDIGSSLDQSQKERLSNHTHERREMETEYPNMENPHFFAMPRERRSAFVAWKLNEMTLRSISKNRSSTDAFDIVISNFNMCKYSISDEEIDQHLDTAEAWLYGVLENKHRYSTNRVVKAYCYIISICLAKNKFTEALKFHAEFQKNYADDEENEFWMRRVNQIIEDEKASRDM
jgi:uncharacterized protein (DUF2225 family)